MPLYHVEHFCHLSVSQQEDLAQAITSIHADMFRTPKIFVHVKFTDVSEATTFIGGKRKAANHIRANVRTGSSRTPQDWVDLCRAIEKAWYDTVQVPQVKKEFVLNTDLRTLIIMGGITAGLESGFVIPEAGGDVNWLGDNWSEFKRKADSGDEEWAGMIKDVKDRGLVTGVCSL